MSGNNEGFAARWSRRKQLVLEEEIKDKQLDSETDAGATESDLDNDLPKELTAEEKLAELNLLTDEDMLDVETLHEESDYSGFMSTGVSESLRKMALAKLFHGKSYNIRDGLDEYDGDYTFFEKLDPNTVTSDMRHMIEVEAKRALAKKEQEEMEEKEKAKLLAEAESVESFDEVDEFDEFADEVDSDDLELVNDISTNSTNEGFLAEDDYVEVAEVPTEINKNDSNNEEVA
jgi:hypothetical protein